MPGVLRLPAYTDPSGKVSPFSENMVPTADIIACSRCGLSGAKRAGHRQCRGCERALRQGAQQTPEARARQASYRTAHREHYRTLNVANARRAKAERHARIDALKGVPCVDCAKTYPPHVMDFDHRDPATKEHEVSHLVNKTTCPWSRILAEIAKCDVVCVCCHRLRTWTSPKKRGSKDRLVASLKGSACADCGGSFHYCQLDFDHVRGDKLGCVPHMGAAAAIRAEAEKCDVVCANCHRVRTHASLKGARRNDPATIDMVWERRGRGPQTLVMPRDEVVPYKFKTGAPAHRPWHDLAGKMRDVEIARIGGISKAMVCVYRKRMGIPTHHSQPKKEF